MQKYLLWLVLFFGLTGCVISPFYRPDIQQGNIITDTMISQLRPGLTKNQVRYVMGTPVLEQNFNLDRWDYVYFFQPGNKKLPAEQRQVSLYFKNDQLDRIVGTGIATPVPQQGRIL